MAAHSSGHHVLETAPTARLQDPLVLFFVYFCWRFWLFSQHCWLVSSPWNSPGILLALHLFHTSSIVITLFQSVLLVWQTFQPLPMTFLLSLVISFILAPSPSLSGRIKTKFAFRCQPFSVLRSLPDSFLNRGGSSSTHHTDWDDTQNAYNNF